MISNEYVEQNRKLHAERADYGTSGASYAREVAALMIACGAKDALDYGCGKQTLSNSLPQFKFTDYDPCIEGLDAMPDPHDVVVSTDVAEHVEPEFVDDYLDDLKHLTKKALFLVVACRPARKTLPDGRNAHLTVHPPAWWLAKLLERFNLQSFNNYGGSFRAVLTPSESPQ